MHLSSKDDTKLPQKDSLWRTCPPCPRCCWHLALWLWRKPSGTALGCHQRRPHVPSVDKEWWQVPERWRCSDTHQAGRHSNPGAEHASAGMMPSGCGFVTAVLSWQSVAVMLEPEPGPVTYHQHLWPLPIHSPPSSHHSPYPPPMLLGLLAPHTVPLHKDPAWPRYCTVRTGLTLLCFLPV